MKKCYAFFLTTALIILCLFFLFSCQPTELQGQEKTSLEETLPREGEQETSSESAPEEKSETPEQRPEAQSGTCSAAWICVSSSQKRYRLENCSFTAQKQDCAHGCFNGTCQKKISAVCTSGIKCVNENIRGYQLEDCSFINEVTCDYGCKEGKCLPQPNETETLTATEPEETPLPPALPELLAGQVVVVSGGNLSIFIIEPEQLQLKWNTKKSDWLAAGQSAVFSGGPTIVVEEIYFQGFEGGKRGITYRVK